MKLTKPQISAVAFEIYNQIVGKDFDKKRNLKRKEIKKEIVEKFLRTDVGKAVTKINTTFFTGDPPIHDYKVEELAYRFYETSLEAELNKAMPKFNFTTNDIERQIILQTIDCSNLDEIISKVKEKFNV